MSEHKKRKKEKNGMMWKNTDQSTINDVKNGNLSPCSEFDSSSDEEDSMVWTAKDEKDFLLTLSALKARDPKIYTDEVKFFNEETSSDISTTQRNRISNKKDSMTLKDYERKLVLERIGHLSEDDDDGVHTNSEILPEEEKALKNAFKNILDSDDDRADTLLKKREKTEEEKKIEDEDYYEWLKGKNNLNICDKNLQKLKQRWTMEDELNDNEKFLRDYLLYKKYKTDEKDGNDRIPTYEEIIQEEEEDRADQFEQKFNFRFEEPDQDFLKQYPRTVSEALRDKKTKRKEIRNEKKKTLKIKKKKIEEVDMPFRYRSVVPNNFGLTTEEILGTDDRCLNAWAPMTKMSQYRSEEEDMRQVMFFQRKAKNVLKKQSILGQKISSDNHVPVDSTPSTGDENNQIHEGNVINSAKRQIRKQTSNKGKTAEKSQSKKKKRFNGTIEELGMDRLKAYGVSVKNLKRVQYTKKMRESKEKVRLQ